MNTSLSRFFILALLAILILFSPGYYTNADDTGMPHLHVNESLYLISAPMQIRVDGILDINKSLYSMRIEHDGSSFVYRGALTDIVDFDAPREGIYTIQLIQTLDNTIVDTKTVSVIDPKLIEPLSEEAFSNRLITLDKKIYRVGERATINVNYKTNNFSLRIVTPTTVYRFIGAPGADVHFTPRELGDHEVQFVVGSNLVEKQSFHVSKKDALVVAGDRYIPYTNIAYEVKNHKGEEQSSVVRIMKNKKVIQSNINPNDRYDVELRPSGMRIQSVKFNNLKFQNSLDLGLEEVDPKKNMDNAIYAFAIDPERLDFTNGSITMIAPANELYKCADYDFVTQTCQGENIRIASVTPGTLITIDISPKDPLFSFQNAVSGCTCSDSDSGNSGTLSCNTYCSVTVDGPGAAALTGFITEVVYTLSLTVTSDGATMSNGAQEGDFDHDQTQSNGNEVNVGTASATTTQTITLTRSNLNSSGAFSFSDVDCNNWPTNCTNYDSYISSSMDFSAPGKSTKSPSMDISLTVINVTWNYTAAGALSVALNEPTPAVYEGSQFVLFNYTPSTSAASITNCSLYTNDSATWQAVNTSSSITNGTANFLGYDFSADGEYLWNVRCIDANLNDEFNPNNRTIYIDTTNPIVSLSSPADNSVQNQSAISFNFSVSDQFPIASCDLLINGSSVTTDSSIVRDTTQSILYSLTGGDYTWSVSCLDEAGNTGTVAARDLTINITPTIYNETWYESFNANCAGTGNCDIDLRQQTDGVTNTRAYTIPGGDTTRSLVNSTSDFLGGNGVYIPSGALVSFSADFSALTGATSTYLSWHLYVSHNNGSESEICFAGDDGSGGQRIQTVGTETDTCTTSQSFTLQGTDRLRLELILFNDHPSQTTTVTHDFDDANSFVSISPFQSLGSLSVSLLEPNASVLIGQGETYNHTCQATCSYGYCLDVDVYAQYNTSATSWTNISSSGNLILGIGESNPIALGNLTGSPATNNTNATFIINGSTASTNNVRCVATDLFADTYVSAQTQQVIVSDATSPVVTLLNPTEGIYTSNTTITLGYNVVDSSGLANCSLYINGTFNQTNQTAITNPGDNSFTVVFAPGAHDFNWTVQCVDLSGFVGNASETRNVSIDNFAPNLTLSYPAPADNIGFETINFNWTVDDNRAENLTCDLYVDGTLNVSSIQSPTGTVINQTVTDFTVGQHNWSVTCQDLAGNSNVSETRIFNVTEVPPTVTLFDPTNQSFVNSTDVTLIYNASDNNGFNQCTLIFDGVINQNNATPVLVNQLNNFTLTTTQGLHNWTVNCTDTSGFSDQPPVFYFTVDTTNPFVNLVNPNGTTLTNANVDFEFNYTDNLSPNATCSIFYNSSTYVANTTNIFSLNNTLTTQTENNLPDGQYTWNASCSDLANNTGQSTIAQFNVSDPPSVTLTAPAPNAFVNGEQINFTFTASDNDGFANCSVRFLTGPNISDHINQSPINNGGSNGIVLTGLAAGTHTWTVQCFDNGTFSNSIQPSARFLFIDNAPPNITLNYPRNDTVNNSLVNFNWTADDDQDLTLSCDLYVDGTLNQSSINSPATTPTNYSVAGFTNGLHNWSVNCTDDAGNSNVSITENFTVAVPPSVTLTEPSQGQWFNFLNDVTFEYIPTANDAINNCSLYIDGFYNQTDDTVTADSPNLFFVNFTDQGNYSWNVFCTDASNLTGGSPTNGSFILDIQPPNLTLHEPQNNSIVTDNNVTFNYTVDDNLAPWLICNLTVDGNPEQENVNLTTNQTYLFNQSFPDGDYSYFLECVDIAGNYNITPTRNFTIIAPPNVTLLNPENNSIVRVNSINLTYLAYDGFPIPECNLTFDGQFNQTSNTINTLSNNTFQVDDITEGVHNWSVTCLDSEGNLGSDGPFYFTADFSAPSISLYDPDNTENITQDDVTFNFTANDTLDTNVTCNLTLDSTIEYSGIDILNALPVQRTVQNITDGIHLWNVSCIDDAQNTNTSETRSFNMSVTPNVTLTAPNPDIWTNNVTLTFYFNASDNDGLENCTLLFDSQHAGNSSSITNNAQNTIINSSVDEGIFNWTVQCIDNGTYANQFTAQSREIRVDRTAPNVTLLYPPNLSIQSTTVTFNYTFTDNLASTINCTLYLDGTNISTTQFANNTNESYTQVGITAGDHSWNVTCTDLAGNIGISQTWNFTVPVPDLIITSTNITFNNTSPTEGENVTINANIFNIGNSSAQNITVQFWLGDPDASGTQIGANQNISSLGALANITLNTSLNVTIGTLNIYVVVDPPFGSGGLIAETNETNNKAFNTIIVGFYNVFSGNATNSLRITDGAWVPVYEWNVTNTTGSNVIVSDIDSTLTFTALHPLGQNITNVSAADDFSDLDIIFGAQNYSDNINTTWTQAGSPKATKSYNLFGRLINNVPIVNSTNSTTFTTGILWDTGDGGVEYDGTQDVAFITQINQSQQGFTGIYDYEAKIPAPLRDYTGSTSRVVFYTELR